MRKLFNDEAGFVVSAELALIVTLIFTAVVVGVAVARDQRWCYWHAPQSW
jgi:hypothetical protein